ncbi:MAG: hypothetical protein CME88_13210 [Hirschia sp.]|nr:hypothetical protein [Hirschia sp.]MBF19328.1 hypothetical protein [Hirschia sp.]
MVDQQTGDVSVSVDLAEIGAELALVTHEIETAFRQTAGVIADELKSAARSGEADFQRMAQAIASELPALAMQRVFAGNGDGHVGAQPMTINVSAPQTGGQASGGALGLSANAIGLLVAQAVRRGGRFT